jgi:uncharacterized phage-associated protein
MILPGYDIEKAAQATAFFALSAGGAINVLKLSKLLYLAEREFMSRYDEPMFYDRLVSMPDGPVASITLNFVNGELESPQWSKYVAPRAGYDIAASNGISLEDLDALSVADLEVLRALWERFRGFDRYKLRDWTHDKNNIPEWIDPRGSSDVIPHERVFQFLLKDNPTELKEDIDNYRAMKKAIDAP